MDDLYPYQGNLSWLRPRTILLVTHGSRAYGLSTPTSDTDIKGVAIPPREYFLGFSKRFEQAETHEPDMVVYEVRKFFSLAADCNPSIIEVLWVDPSDIRVQTKQGQKLLEARELFLSKKARFTFSGYAHAQLKRINTHYRWLKTPPGAPPTRAELGLPERTLIPADQLEAAQAAIRKKLDQWNPSFLDELDSSVRIGVLGRMTEYLADIQVNADTQWIAAGRSIGYDENFIRLLDLEKRYEARKKEWDQYQEWKATRNPARAALEAKYGMDTKHAAHLVRLMRMCREILTTGQVIVKRPDREELLAIKQGAWSYEQLIEWASQQEAEMESLYRASPLRKTPDRDKLDALCQELVESMLSSDAAPL